MIVVSNIDKYLHFKKKKKKKGLLRKKLTKTKGIKWRWIESHWKYYTKNYISYIRPANRITIKHLVIFIKQLVHIIKIPSSYFHMKLKPNLEWKIMKRYRKGYLEITYPSHAHIVWLWRDIERDFLKKHPIPLKTIIL